MRRETKEGGRLGSRRAQRGFTLIELVIATVVMLVGIVAVMQLVPAAIRSNLMNRLDTRATVMAQRMMDLMVNSGVNSAVLVDPTGGLPCGTTVVCNLGATAGLAGQDIQNGAPLTAQGTINFNQGPVPNYSFTYVDPNDPAQTSFDVRWAVITSIRSAGTQLNIVDSRRYIVGARSLGTTTPVPVTLISWQSR